MTEHIIQNSKKRYTIVYKLEETNGNLNVTFATAHAAPRDNFSRKLGRTIASGRLANGTDNVYKLVFWGNRTPTEANGWRNLEAAIASEAEMYYRRKPRFKNGE